MRILFSKTQVFGVKRLYQPVGRWTSPPKSGQKYIGIWPDLRVSFIFTYLEIMQGYVVCDNFWCKEHKASHNEDQAVQSRASNEQWGSESSKREKLVTLLRFPKRLLLRMHGGSQFQSYRKFPQKMHFVLKAEKFWLSVKVFKPLRITLYSASIHI